MLELLCRIRYSRLLFILLALPSLLGFYVGAYEKDVANSVNGITTISVHVYLFGTFGILMSIVFLITAVDLMFDLDFDEDSDKIQEFFKRKKREREQENLNQRIRQRDLDFQQKKAEAIEKEELNEFVEYCKKQGGVK